MSTLVKFDPEYAQRSHTKLIRENIQLLDQVIQEQETVSEKKKAYAKKTNAIIDKVGNLSDKNVESVLDLLEQARKDIIVDIATLPEESWRRSVMEDVISKIDKRINQYKQKATDELTTQENEMWDHAKEDTQSLLGELTGINMVTVPQDLLEVSRGFTADLITNLSNDARDDINSAIRLGMIRKDSLNKMMGKIGRSLDEPSVFGTIANRAEVITRTETMRVYSMSAQAHRQKFADRLSKDKGIVLYKKWDAAEDRRTRPTHRKADGQVVKQTEKFEVGKDKLRYPRDPAGSARETVQCRCTSYILGDKLIDDLEAWEPEETLDSDDILGVEPGSYKEKYKEFKQSDYPKFAEFLHAEGYKGYYGEKSGIYRKVIEKNGKYFLEDSNKSELEDILKKKKEPEEPTKKKPQKTSLMKQFEDETGKNAIWHGKITKNFQQWEEKYKKKPKQDIKDLKKTTGTFEEVKPDKAEDYFERNFKKFNSTLSKEGEEGLRWYKESEQYSLLNDPLRREVEIKPKYQEKLDQLDKAFNNSEAKLEENTLLWRGASFIDRHHLEEAFGTQDLSELVGGIFDDKGFISTSLDKKAVKGYASMADIPVRFKIEAPAGTPALDLRTKVKIGKKENEILLPRDSQFKVKNAQQQSDGSWDLTIKVQKAEAKPEKIPEEKPTKKPKEILTKGKIRKKSIGGYRRSFEENTFNPLNLDVSIEEGIHTGENRRILTEIAEKLPDIDPSIQDRVKKFSVYFTEGHIKDTKYKKYSKTASALTDHDNDDIMVFQKDGMGTLTAEQKKRKFAHELGHAVIGDKLPSKWKALKHDPPTSYGKTSPNEDFAESFRLYIQGKLNVKGYYAEREKLIEEILQPATERKKYKEKPKKTKTSLRKADPEYKSIENEYARRMEEEGTYLAQFLGEKGYKTFEQPDGSVYEVIEKEKGKYVWGNEIQPEIQLEESKRFDNTFEGAKEAKNWDRKHSKTMFNKISLEEELEIGEYVGGFYEEINAKLRLDRKLSEEDKEYIEKFDSIVDKGQIPEQVVLYRGVNDSAFLAEDLDTLQGKTITDKAFCSVASNPINAEGYARRGKKPVMMELHTKKGQKACFASSVTADRPREEYEETTETEIILPRNSEFEVVEVSTYTTREGEEWLLLIAKVN